MTKGKSERRLFTAESATLLADWLCEFESQQGIEVIMDDLRQFLSFKVALNNPMVNRNTLFTSLEID